MQFLRKNKTAVLILLTLPFSFYYLDMALIDLLLDFQRGESPLYRFFVAMRAPVDFLSNGMTLAAASLAVLIIGRFYSPRMYDVGKSLTVSFAVSGILVQLLKHLIGRARPMPGLTHAADFIGPHVRGGYDSFPSGHTMVTFCLAYALCRHFPRYRFLFYIPPVIIGFQRFEKSAHFFSDVLAGALVGVLCGRFLFAYVLPAFSKSPVPGQGNKVDA